MTSSKRPAKVAKKAPAKKAAPAKRAAKRAPAKPETLNLRKGEQWVAMDGANIRHIADTASDNWAEFSAPICGARPVVAPFVPTNAKLPVCDNCKAAW